MLSDSTKVRFHVRAMPDSELYWSSYLYCGLYDLVAEGRITLRFAPRLTLHPHEVLGTVLEVTDRSGETRVLTFDWRDNPDVVCPEKLARSDLYFKRNYIPVRTHPVCPPDQRRKLRPAGLSFALRSERERPLWTRVVGGLCRVDEPVLQSSARATLRGLYKGVVRSPLMTRSLPRERDFEADPIEEARNVVFYQSLAYDPAASSFPDDTRAVMEERVAVVRALRKGLGDAFVGGLVPDPYVRESFADCVTTGSVDRPSYIERMKGARICVYTRGLRESPAFKLAEYLASGRCILAEPPRTVLPAPLRDGEHLLYFRSVDELVEKARALLRDPALQRRLSLGARAYYETEIRPRRRVLAALEAAFEVGARAGDPTKKMAHA